MMIDTMGNWKYTQSIIDDYIDDEYNSHELEHPIRSDRPKVKKMKKHREDGPYNPPQKRVKKKRRNRS